MRQLETLIPPPLVAVFVAAGMFAAARWWPLATVAVPHPWLVGVAIASVGGVVSSAGAAAFRRHRTTVNPLHPERATSVVGSGIYRFTRNPMYLGLLLVLVGCLAVLGAASALAGPVAFVLYIARFQIAPEERVLEAKFGAEYLAYKVRVRRWL